MARIGATPGDWKTEPMPESAARQPFARSFSADEFRRLQQGLVPEEMEDKWFIVWHDDALWCHRSWTGLCVYCLRFAADGERFVVAEARVNRPPEAHAGRDAQDAQALAYLLDTFLEFSRRRR